MATRPPNLKAPHGYQWVISIFVPSMLRLEPPCPIPHCKGCTPRLSMGHFRLCAIDAEAETSLSHYPFVKDVHHGYQWVISIFEPSILATLHSHLEILS